MLHEDVDEVTNAVVTPPIDGRQMPVRLRSNTDTIVVGAVLAPQSAVNIDSKSSSPEAKPVFEIVKAKEETLIV